MPAGSWIAHIKATRKSMGAGASYSAAMKKAATTWKKSKAAAPKKKGRKKKSKISGK